MASASQARDFAHTFYTHRIEEWKPHYLHYRELLAIIDGAFSAEHAAAADSPLEQPFLASVSSPPVSSPGEARRAFEAMLNEQTQRLDDFYAEIESHLELDFATLERRGKRALAELPADAPPHLARLANAPDFSQQLFFQLYRRLIMLLNFSKLNFIALDLCLRHHDETFRDSLHQQFFQGRWQLHSDELNLFNPDSSDDEAESEAVVADGFGAGAAVGAGAGAGGGAASIDVRSRMDSSPSRSSSTDSATPAPFDPPFPSPLSRAGSNFGGGSAKSSGGGFHPRGVISGLTIPVPSSRSLLSTNADAPTDFELYATPDRPASLESPPTTANAVAATPAIAVPATAKKEKPSTGKVSRMFPGSPRVSDYGTGEILGKFSTNPMLLNQNAYTTNSLLNFPQSSIVSADSVGTYSTLPRTPNAAASSTAMYNSLPRTPQVNMPPPIFLPSSAAAAGAAAVSPFSSNASASKSSPVAVAVGEVGGAAATSAHSPVPAVPFFVAMETSLVRLIHHTIAVYAACFESGDTVQAKVHLLASINDYSTKLSKHDTFRFGLKIGACGVMIVWLVSMLFNMGWYFVDDGQAVAKLSATPVYRFCALFLLLGWLWGVNVWVFSKFRINYTYIFDMDARTRLTHFQIWEDMSNLTLIYLANVILYLLHFQTWLLGLVPAIAFPMALLCFFLMKFFGPLTFMSQPSSRWFVLSSLREILKSPFGRLTFREQFIADILTSLIKVIVDVERSLCFYLTGSWLSSAPMIQPGVDVFDAPRCHEINLYAVAMLSVLPLWLRFMQTLRRYYNTGQRFPHFANAMKYALSQTVVFMGIFHPLYTHTSIHDWNWHRWVWLLLAIASALYTFTWDVTMDWGLFGSDTSAAKGAAPHHHHGFGRRLLFHRHRWVRDLSPVPSISDVYYVAIAIDFILRFAWTVTLMPASINPYWGPATAGLSDSAAYEMAFLTIIMGSEVFRRMMWSILRVELEHLALVDKFQTFEYVPIYFQTKETDKADTNQPPSSGVLREILTAAVVIAIVTIVTALW